MAIQISGTTVIDNSRNVVNVIGVGATGTTSFYGDGSKLTGVSGGDGGAFNTGITSSINAILTGVGATVLTLPSTAGKEYIVYSIHAANVAAGNTDANVIGAFDFNGRERSYFAYNIPVPTGMAVELLQQPQILNPSDRITMRATDIDRVGIDSGIQVFVTYQEKTATNYFGIGFGPVAISTTAPVGIYTATTASILQSIRLANTTDLGGFPITVTVTNGVTTRSLVENLIVPKYTSVELLETPKRLNVNEVLKVDVEQLSTIDVQISGTTATA